MKRKSLGISRNKYQILMAAKGEVNRKKNIFKYVGKQEDLTSQFQNHNNTNHLLSATTKNSSGQSVQNYENPTSDLYDLAKNYLDEVAQYKKKMTSQIKLRMASFKESQIKLYDQNINKYSAKAIEHLLKSQKILAMIKQLKGQNQTEYQFYRNMERSLGLEVRQASKGLRAQQKEYYDRIKAYETGTANLAIQLNQQDRLKMKDQNDDIEVLETQMGDDLQRNKQITDLVKSINQLNGIYKQLNELVIEQGSLIDRIDFNIEQAFLHVQKGVVHLQGANQNAQSPCARKCMCFLIIGILLMAIVIGFKLSK